MSKDIEQAMIPATKEIPFDYRVTDYRLFMTSYGPAEYTSWLEESMSWKESCMIGDWSPLVKVEMKGPDVQEFLKTISGINTKVFEVGQAKHIVFPNRKGKVLGEGIVCRLSEDTYRITGGPNFVLWAHYNLTKTDKWQSESKVVNDDYFIYQVQGPTSVDILEELVGPRLRDIEYMHLKELEVCGVKTTFLRQGMSGNIGFEITGPSDKALEIYGAILEAGEKHGGVVRVGEIAKFVNHVEGCFPTPTVEYMPALYDEDDMDLKIFREQVMGPAVMGMDGTLFKEPAGSSDNDVADAIFSPVELGWSYSLCFDHEFPGSDILKEEKENPRRKIVTLVWNDEDVKAVNDSYFEEGEPYKFFELPRGKEAHPDKVLKNGEQVGLSISRMYSYYLRKMISLCVLDTDLCVPDEEVEVVWGTKGRRLKNIRAVVQESPIYNPDKKRSL